MDALVLCETAKELENGQSILHIARDDIRMENMAELAAYFAPDVEVITFPAWDCLPYDRVSPNPDILARRMTSLIKIISASKKQIIISTINAVTQLIPARDTVKSAGFKANVGDDLDINALTDYLSHNGYSRASTVVDHGDFAIRGNIIDIFPPGSKKPLRIDLWGDEIDTIKIFDPINQRTEDKTDKIELVPMGEVFLNEASINRFKRAYLSEFGPARGNDPLYEAVSEARKHAGMEHWLPYYHEKLETLFDYLPAALVTMDNLTTEAFEARLSAISDYYLARKSAFEQAPNKRDSIAPYKPVPPEQLFMSAAAWEEYAETFKIHQFNPFDAPQGQDVRCHKGSAGRNFAPERNDKEINIYDALRKHVVSLQESGKKTYLASYSVGARDRLSAVLSDHGMARHKLLDSWKSAKRLPKDTIGLVILAIEHGFETDKFAIISEQDILGDRLIRKVRRTRKAENFISEASSLTPGDLVIHMDHGIGRYVDLKTIDVGGAAHDCVLLTYHGGDKLYVPVENIEILSRYGNEESDGKLDKLGSVAWQGRKATLKKRIREMADELIKVAAERALRKGEVIKPADGLYNEFCARFPYTETDDQLRAIGDVINDLSSGRPMDRLICGDVGFGKTEVALRSAFLAVMEGFQVAIVAPTTLLARQHFKTFTDRFKGLNIKVGHLSRLVTPKIQKLTKEEVSKGDCEILIGTHAVLGDKVQFNNLGLLVIDEEQHFGVGHKEKLKKLKSNVHVLTLTATPIPRTLQLAMSGIQGLSLIATPPIDRLAVRTFVLPMDDLVIREALLREHYRGGQSFYVCPRISDLKEVAEFLKEVVPEVKVVTAHGRMAPGQIEDIMNAFYDGAYDVLLSTTIVESGLDIPTANTMIIHRADNYGLAQLYQLRGRVGRSKVRAYAYLTLPPRRIPTPQAEKRLHVLQTLDTLGAGFTLASHDLDIRGAGNLLGDEQSGHIKEVGIELYQQMLEEAVAQAKSGSFDGEIDQGWSPQINVGASVMIPERYVKDLNLRMSLYRRIAGLDDKNDVDAFGAELIDRFGTLPEEVEHLLKIIEIKQYCRRAGIEKIETGPKGAIISFRNSKFANPGGLIEFLTKQGSVTKLRPDHKLVYVRKWSKIESRLIGSLNLSKAMAKIAEK
ncbi:MAG: transcription-repair coupling factor [Kordiimonadaceae bacterium]|nr:transcription-repair coupling factor [Kordiimonadaceae bacterium]MBT6035811.1 transcription-repair coupling factor [Kordiimonadaceae bacterium]